MSKLGVEQPVRATERQILQRRVLTRGGVVHTRFAIRRRVGRTSLHVRIYARADPKTCIAERVG